MLDKLRDRLTAYLAEPRPCILAVAGEGAAWAIPVPYRACGLDIECLLPRWADAAYHVEQNPRVVLVFLPVGRAGAQGRAAWLQYRGAARLAASPDWSGWRAATASASPPDLYCVLCVTPERLDWIDESRGWGARETLEV
ncbi:MAG: pyridoxamine 5'-phosphate oxidase family protein [Chloroflexi bacterium]|nr:pyridoxamine 5'-phosphate oxidase family protein [Chloroflexota bacterium]